MTRSASEPAEVEARFGPDGSIRPIRFTVRDVRHDVMEIGRSWRDGGATSCTHVLVRAAGGQQFELSFDPITLHWTAQRLGAETRLA